MLLKRPRRSIFEKKRHILQKKVIYKKIGIAF